MLSDLNVNRLQPSSGTKTSNETQYHCNYTLGHNKVQIPLDWIRIFKCFKGSRIIVYFDCNKSIFSVGFTAHSGVPLFDWRLRVGSCGFWGLFSIEK